MDGMFCLKKKAVSKNLEASGSQPVKQFSSNAASECRVNRYHGKEVH
jgi:hypothetical protein